LIVHASGVEQTLLFVSQFPEKARVLADHFWPGPLTLLLDKTSLIPDLITAGSKRVAIRVPQHPVALELLRMLSFPLVAPSANPYTKVSPTRAEDVHAYFGNALPLILQGGTCSRGLESTIIGFEGQESIIYRLGSIPVESIQSLIGPVRIKNQKDTTVLAPGMSPRHYSPETHLIVTEDIDSFQKSHPEKRSGVFSRRDDLPEVLAPRFYARLMEMDKMGYDCLLAEWFPEEGLGRTLNDRLRRAAEAGNA
jgi:L-threonylcarbamoyladenylate synthase